MRYTLWHLDTGNLIGDFAEKSAALEAVRLEIATNDDADRLILEDEEDRGAEPLSGSRLMAILANGH